MQVLLIATDNLPQLCPVTHSTPASLIPIVSRPVMALAVELLARAGLKQIMVCHAPGNQEIAGYFGNGQRWGVRISYVPLNDQEHILPFAAARLTDTTLVLPAAATCRSRSGTFTPPSNVILSGSSMSLSHGLFWRCCCRLWRWW